MTETDLDGPEKMVLAAFGLVYQLFETWALLVLWHWFMVPLGAASVTYAHVFGINALVAVFIFRSKPMPKTREEYINSHAQYWAISIVALLGGWIAHWYV